MAELTQIKLDGISSEVEHHRIAKILKLATTNAEVKRLEVEGDKPEELAEAKAEALQLESDLNLEGIAVRVSMPEYNYGIGLVMGRGLIISSLQANLNDLRRKIIAIRGVI